MVVCEEGTETAGYFRAGNSLVSCVERQLWAVLLTKCYSGDEITKKVVGGACSTYVEEELRTHGFGGETWSKDHLKNLHVHGDNIKTDLQ